MWLFSTAIIELSHFKNQMYSNLFIETFYFTGGGAPSGIRARPLPGQGFQTSICVECSKSMRNAHPEGTIFYVSVKVTDREGGNPFLYMHYSSPYKIVSREFAEAEIASS